jgi:hypothetical protein
MGTFITISASIEKVITWFTEQSSEDLAITLTQSEKDNEEWRVQLHTRTLMDSNKWNLGELLLTSISDDITQIDVVEPKKLEQEEVMLWAYPEILTANMKDFVHSEEERLLLRAAGLSRLFLDVGYHDSDMLMYMDFFSEYLKYTNILRSVPDKDLIRPKYRQTTADDTWQTIARDFYGDEKFVPQALEAMAAYSVEADDLEPDSYLPYLYILRKPHPEFSIGQINSAIQYLEQTQGNSLDDKWIPVSAIFGLSLERTMEILLHIYQVAMSVMENPKEMLVTWEKMLLDIRQRKVSEFLSKLQAAFAQK